MDDAEVQARWAMLLEHRDLALAMVLRATGSMADAEDSVQDAMLRLSRREDLDPSRVRALLVRAALHAAIDRRRAARRERGAVVRLGGGARAAVMSPEEVQLLRAEAARVLAAIDSLPRRERQVMLLRLAGFSVAETAARLGISPKSVEGAYTRARARVRYLLGSLFGRLSGALRRLGSPGGEAAATTLAALLFAVPAWLGAVHGPFATAHPGAKSAAPPSRPATGHAASVEPAKPEVGRAHPDGTSDPPPPRKVAALRLRSGLRLHNPRPPDTILSVEIDGPDGLFSTGFYVYGHMPGPGDVAGYPAGMQWCLQHLDPGGTYIIC